MDEFSKKVKEWLEERGLSRKWLAEKTNIPINTLNVYLSPKGRPIQGRSKVVIALVMENYDKSFSKNFQNSENIIHHSISNNINNQFFEIFRNFTNTKEYKAFMDVYSNPNVKKIQEIISKVSDSLPPVLRGSVAQKHEGKSDNKVEKLGELEQFIRDEAQKMHEQIDLFAERVLERIKSDKLAEK